MTDHLIYLVCAADGDSPGSWIQEVRSNGGSILLGESVLCTTDEQRVQLALEKGFATRAERDNARFKSIVFEPRPEGWFPRWALTFDMTDYQTSLDRL